MAAPPLHLSPCLNPTFPPTPSKTTPTGGAGPRRTTSPPSPQPEAPRRPPPGDPGPFIPTMSHIVEASRAQNLRLELRTLGPFFRVRGLSLERGGVELGRAEGVIRPWFGGWVLHLDSMRMGRGTLGLDRSIFGLGLFVGAAAVRHGFDRGCRRAELLAINDTDLYHLKVRDLGFFYISLCCGMAVVVFRRQRDRFLTAPEQLVRFYTRMGFTVVREVEGSSPGDLPHMLVWGGRGTRMDASVEDLLVKWGSRFRPPPS